MYVSCSAPYVCVLCMCFCWSAFVILVVLQILGNCEKALGFLYHFYTIFFSRTYNTTQSSMSYFEATLTGRSKTDFFIEKVKNVK